MVPIRSQCKDEKEYLEALRVFFAAAALTGLRASDDESYSADNPEWYAQTALKDADRLIKIII